MSCNELIERQRENICCTPEINLSLADADAVFAAVLAEYGSGALRVNHFDGLSVEMPGNWRFALCKSKTEPLVRLNFEARGPGTFLLDKAAELLRFLAPYGVEDSHWSNRLTIC